MNSSQPRRRILLLLVVSLLASAIHFADNAWRLDLYPGPFWLTRRAILLAWLVLPLAACAAYRIGTRGAFVMYASLGFAGFAHFLVPRYHAMPLRCVLTILGEAVTSMLLIVFVLRPAFSPTDPAKIVG